MLTENRLYFESKVFCKFLKSTDFQLAYAIPSQKYTYSVEESSDLNY